MNKLISRRIAVYVFVPFTIISFLLLEANFYILKEYLPGFRTSTALLQKNIQNELPSHLSSLESKEASLSRAYVTLYMLNTLDTEVTDMAKQSTSASLNANAHVWEYSCSLELNLKPFLKTRNQVLLI